ncbi:MAG: hypothetical protein Q8O89_02065 [Nanoarchaeota archaeon]|nr:hypothetical protein [Nanoarchaeota archaeon]
MGTLLCTNCKYSFAPKKPEMPKRCPYCSKEGTLVDEEEFLGL